MAKQVFKNHHSIKRGIAIKSFLIGMILSLVFTSVSFAEGGGRYKGADAWSFGVHGDTQWTLSNTYVGSLHTNKNYVNGELIDLLNGQFKNAGVKFVVQVGDLTDRAGDPAMGQRALRAKSLYDAGIGFFPLRGNHETYGSLYGYDSIHSLNIPAFRSNFSQTRGLTNTFGATNFSSPAIDALNGLSYSFDYGDNARFVIVDVEQTATIHKVAPVDPLYGQGYLYAWVTVYKATATVPGGSIPEGAYFFLDINNNPTTDFAGAGMDIVTYPIDAWKAIESYDASGTEFWPGMQQEWISSRLDEATRGTEHAFVFSHRPLIGADHVDGFFGANPNVTPDDQNDFYASLYDNNVRYMISGHDHIYNRALVESPNLGSEVEQLISIGASSKFYGPGELESFGGAKNRETQISQEINNVGYYIYTIDGPRVTVDYYSDLNGNLGGDYCYPHGSAHGTDPAGVRIDNPYRSCANFFGYGANAEPTKTVDGIIYPTGPVNPGKLHVTAADFNFVKKETWGYSNNGQQFVIVQGESYDTVEDSFEGTTAKIIAGTNNSTSTDLTPEIPRPLNKTVNTGWAANPDPTALKSNILSLWGMSELGADDVTDTYTLSISFEPQKSVRLGHEGSIGTIVTLNKNGQWVNAVDENFSSGTKKFISGPYKAKYGLGTYGYDPSTRSAWAVLNYNADFAVVNNIITVPPGQAK